MRIDIYQSNVNSTKFLTVPAGTDLSTLKVRDTDYVSVKPFKTDRECNEGDSRIAFDSDAAIAAIKADGYYLHRFDVSFKSA
jgi:hypothetical protein